MSKEILLLNDFINTYQYPNGVLYKIIESGSNWNGFAKSISPFIEYLPQSGIWFTTPSITNPQFNGQNIEFAFGLSSNQNYNPVNYSDIDYGFYFNVGPNGNTVNLIINGTLLSSNITYGTFQYGIQFDANNNLILTLSQLNSSQYQVLYQTPVNSGTLQVNFPLYFYIYSYNTFTYPLLFNVDFIGINPLEVINISPSISQPIGLTNSFEFTFNRPLDQSSINTSTILYNNGETLLTNYTVELISSNIIQINFGNPRLFNTVYNIQFENIKGFEGGYYSNIFNFITISSETQVVEQLTFNTNVNDVFWQLNNIEQLLDIDKVFSSDFLNKTGYSFNPTTFLPITGEYSVDKNTDLNFNNQEIIINLLQNQLAYYFENFISNIQTNNSLVKMFLKNIVSINNSKGTKVSLEFLMNLLGAVFNSFVNMASSKEKLIYDVYTSIPEETYISNLEENIHPCGLYYNFNSINTINYNNIYTENTSILDFEELFYNTETLGFFTYTLGL